MNPNNFNRTPLPRAGVIRIFPERCLACRECELACSLVHEGQCNPELSRIRVLSDDFVPGFPDIRVCKQCQWPACLYACASRWEEPALRIDEQTGARYIDPELCKGCGLCLRACPLTPERPVIGIKNEGKRRQYIKCDLCREWGEPICVVVCPGDALQYIPAKERTD